jgi:hypothetical protein
MLLGLMSTHNSQTTKKVLQRESLAHECNMGIMHGSYGLSHDSSRNQKVLENEGFI